MKYLLLTADKNEQLLCTPSLELVTAFSRCCNAFGTETVMYTVDHAKKGVEDDN